MRQIANTFLWLALLPVVGTVEVLRMTPRVLSRLGWKGFLMLATLVVLWRTNSQFVIGPFTEVTNGVLGPSVLPWVVLTTAAFVVSRGVRSPMRRRLYRRLRRSG
jgi:hypothetical protein